MGLPADQKENVKTRRSESLCNLAAQERAALICLPRFAMSDWQDWL
jgi:hypothetical protein